MKAFAAILAFALCNSAILVQGGIIGDLTNTITTTLNAIIGNLNGLVGGLIPIKLPDTQLGLNVDVTDLKVALDSLKIAALEDNNLLDLQIDNLTVQLPNVIVQANVSITNLTLPGDLGNVSVAGDISIAVTNVRVTATVGLKVQILKIVISDLTGIRVTADAAVAASASLDPAVIAAINLDLDLVAKVVAEIEKTLQENQESLITLINNNAL